MIDNTENTMDKLEELESIGYEFGEKSELSVGQKLNLLNCLTYNQYEKFTKTVFRIAVTYDLKMPKELSNYKDNEFYTYASAFLTGLQNGSI